ncbi:Arm DNA-binding domain-containing protein, partial [Rhizobium sp. PL01]|uniref:Arm DNA-binding domain-containing protein n=1 Tax=Rhizobium sp. PL01 TaxID=3085631 RepID=UPI0029816B5E
MPVKLTDRFCKHAPATEKRQEIADLGFPGLYLIIQQTGSKSFAVRYSIGGKVTKATLGSYPAIPLAKARELAQGIVGQVTTGVDPKVAERERKEQEARLKSDTLETVLADYTARRLSKLRPRTAAGYRWLLNRNLA